MGNKNGKGSQTMTLSSNAGKSRPPPPILAYLVGNPGAGKTTMCNGLMEKGVLTQEAEYFTKFVPFTPDITLELQFTDRGAPYNYHNYTGENVNGDGLWRPYLKLVFIMVDLGLTLEELKTQCHDWLMSISLNTSVTDMNLIVFLGNKTDLERPGNREVVEEFAKKVQALYFPVCASTGQGVEEALAESTKECHNKRSRNTLVKWDEFMGVEAAPSPQRMARRSSLTINFAMQE